MRQTNSAPGSQKSFFRRRNGRLAAVAAVMLAAQVALLQSFMQFSSEVSTERARQQTERRLYSQSRLEAARAVSLYPWNGYALFQLAASDFVSAPVSDGDAQKKAQQSLKVALPWMPHQPNILRLLGQTHYYLKDYGTAAAILDRFFRMVPTPAVTADHLQLVRSMAHFRTGEQGKAALPLTLAASFPGKASELLVPRLLNSLALNQENSAEATLRAAIRSDGGRSLSDRQIQELFAAAAGIEKLPVLSRILQSALGSAAGSEAVDPRLFKYLVGAYLKSGHADKAAEVVRQLRDRAPQDADLPLMLGDIEFHRGNISGARQHYGEHLRIRPDSPLRGELERKVGGEPFL